MMRSDRASAYNLPSGAIYTVVRTYRKPGREQVWVVLGASFELKPGETYPLPPNDDGTPPTVRASELVVLARENPGLYGEWRMTESGFPVWQRAYASRDGQRHYVYRVELVGAKRTGASRYDVSYVRTDGDFDARYRAAGGTGGYVGQAKTRDGAFRMAARSANTAGLIAVKGNPVRTKLRSTGRRKGRIRQSLRTVSRGVTADVRRAFGGRLPRSFRKNPMSRKDFELMAALIAQAQINGASEGALIALTDFAVEMGKATNPRFDADRFARRIVQLVSEGKPFRYVNKNPRRNPLAIYGALAGNPSRSGIHAELGRVIEIRYKRKDDGGFYFHRFKTRPRLLALSDGTLAVRQ